MEARKYGTGALYERERERYIYYLGRESI